MGRLTTLLPNALWSIVFVFLSNGSSSLAKYIQAGPMKTALNPLTYKKILSIKCCPSLFDLVLLT